MRGRCASLSQFARQTCAKLLQGDAKGGRQKEFDHFFRFLRTSSTTTRAEICNFGAPSPVEALHWIFCFFSSIYVQFSKTSPLKSGENSEKSSGENRVKSCHVCGCHGFFGPDFRDSFDHFLITFSDASVTFLVIFLPNSFCRTPFEAG